MSCLQRGRILQQFTSEPPLLLHLQSSQAGRSTVCNTVHYEHQHTLEHLQTYCYRQIAEPIMCNHSAH